jgi:hypothetical protein
MKIPSIPRCATLLAIAVAATTWLTAPIAASATPVTYVFDPNAALIDPAFFGMNRTPVTGFFTVDLATLQETNVTINIPGLALGPSSDDLTHSVLLPLGSSIFACDEPFGAPPQCTTPSRIMTAFTLSIAFTAPLDGSGPATLSGFFLDIDEVGGPMGSASGTASPVVSSPVPEPASLALLGVAVGLFFLRPWLNLRGPLGTSGSRG